MGVERRSALGPLAAVSWPWVVAWGALEPPRRDDQNAQKTKGEKLFVVKLRDGGADIFFFFFVKTEGTKNNRKYKKEKKQLINGGGYFGTFYFLYFSSFVCKISLPLYT